MKGMFYPALHLGDFEDAHSALNSVGVSGALADMCVAGLADNPGYPAAYRADMIDTDESATKTVIVLAPVGQSSIRLCFGFIDLLATSEAEALRLVRDTLKDDSRHSTVEPERPFYAFQWVAPRRVLQ